MDLNDPSSPLLFPTATFSMSHHLQKPLPITAEFLNKELCPGRLHDIAHMLWLAGRPLPPRPLHQQLLLAREIMPAEQIELHLVWKRGVIFVKPMPRYLLHQSFSTFYLEQDVRLAKCARGLLYSYIALVRYECDLAIAKLHNLLPGDMDWAQWQTLSHSFLDQYAPSSQSIYAAIDERYWYGELRLGRLNKIYRLRLRTWGDVLYGYSTLTAHNQKADVFSDNLRALAASLAYLVIVLQAMQVGLSTEFLSATPGFQRACYGLSIFSILAPLVALSALMVMFSFLLVASFISTLQFERRRFRSMGQHPPRLGEDKREAKGKDVS